MYSHDAPPILFFADGDKDEKNLRGRTVGTHNAGGCEELFRAIRTGKFSV